MLKMPTKGNNLLIYSLSRPLVTMLNTLQLYKALESIPSPTPLCTHTTTHANTKI